MRIPAPPRLPRIRLRRPSDAAARLPDLDDGFLDDAPEWVRALVYAASAAFFSATIIVAIVFAAWLASPASTVPAGQALSAGIQGWLLAHGAPITVGSGRVGLIPWLLTLLPLASLRWSAQRLLSDGGQDAEARRERAADLLPLGLSFAGAYALIAFFAALFARLPSAHAIAPAAGLGAFLLAVLGFGIACRDLPGPAEELRERFQELARGRIPVWLRRGALPAAQGVLALLSIGALGSVIYLLVRADRIVALYQDLAPGWIGAIVITLGQVLYLPTAAAWTVAVTAGPGFSVGAGVDVTIRSADTGVLPLVPVFGALPDPGPMPTWFLAAALVPVAVGAAVGWTTIRRGPRFSSWQTRAASVAAACGLTGLGMTIVFALCSGAMGGQRLGYVGVSPLPAGAALVGELLLGGLLAFAASVVRVRFLPRRGRARAEADARTPDPVAG